MDRPWIPRTAPGIRYIDHLSTEELRRKAAESSHYDPQALCEINFINDGRPLDDILGDWIDLDLVAASHVVEHVPDLLRWLCDIEKVLRTGGRLLLAAPNKRYMFDKLRRVTNIEDTLANYLEHRTQPSPLALLSHFLHFATNGDQSSWLDDVEAADLTLLTEPAVAWQWTKDEVASGKYRDVHVSVFTPYSFVKLLKGLTSLGLLPFELVSVDDLSFEFLAVLITCDAGADIPARLSRLDEAAAKLDVFIDDYLSSEFVVREPRIWPIDAAAAQAQRAEVQLLRAALELQSREIQRMQKSLSWKLTKPLRHLRSQFSKR